MNIKTIDDLIEYETWEYKRPFAEILEDNFTDNGRIHNWRNYVDAWLKEHWLELDRETRLVIFLMAYKEADKEYWD
jgi:hypothetical protein